jgi:GDPmannose 4,6-dehydratase
VDHAVPGAGDPVKALIFGGTGQDGTYLIEHLLRSGHEVVATHRQHRSGLSPGSGSIMPTVWLSTDRGALDRLRWLWADVRNPDVVTSVIIDAQPDVVFNLAAVTTPGATWLTPQTQARTAEIAATNTLGVLHVLSAVERCLPSARVVHASSSAIYDSNRYGLYGASKLLAHEIVKGYRLRGLWAANAVLFSHTSPRQDPRYLVPSICRAAARIMLGSREHIDIAAPGSLRDWLSARDAVRALVTIAEQGVPADYDVASGARWTVAIVVEMALVDTGRTAQEVIVDGGQESTVEQPAFLHPLHALGWKPELTLPLLVSGMVLDAATAKAPAETTKEGQHG